MDTVILRERLHQLINSASDESLPMIYHAVGIAVAPAKNWWEDKDIISEFDERVESWLINDEAGYSMEDIDLEISRRKNS